MALMAAVRATDVQRHDGPKVAEATKADPVIAVPKAAVLRRVTVIVGPKDAAMAASLDRAVKEIADRKRAVLAMARPKAVGQQAPEVQVAAAACEEEWPDRPAAVAVCPDQWRDRPAAVVVLHRSTPALTIWSASWTKSSAS